MAVRSTSKDPIRKAGRPVRGTADQRSALLDAAKVVFARNGFAGASLRQIATEAAVTPALTSYYFGDKAGLLSAVIEERVAPILRSLLEAMLAAGDDPIEALQAFVRGYTQRAASNRWLPQLIVREVLNEQGVLRETFATRFATGLTAALLRVVVRGQQRNALRTDLQPEHIVMSLISLCVFPFIATPMVSGALGIRVDEDSTAALAAHHWSLFLSGVEPAQ